MDLNDLLKEISSTADSNSKETRITQVSHFFQDLKKVKTSDEYHEWAKEVSLIVRHADLDTRDLTELYSMVYKKLFGGDISNIAKEHSEFSKTNNGNIITSSMGYDILKYHFGKIIEAEKAEK